MISVVIPVYRESENLEDILKNLSEENSEIIVIVDEPSEKMKRLKEKFQNVIFIFRERRMGKWSALNLGIEKAKGEIIIFLDSDVKVEKDFLKRVKEEFKDCDLLDFIKITERKGFLGKMIYYDYLGYNFANFILKDKIIALNGAGFAIKRRDIRFRKEILEDMDFGTQCYKKGWKYKLSRIKIIVGYPQTFKEWIRQRKRWYYGAGIWLKENLKTIFKFIKEKPLSIVSAMFTFPITFSLPFMFLGLSSLFIGFIFATILYSILSSHLDLYFNPFEFLIFYFIYQPINFILFLIMLILFFKKVEVDWVC